MGPANNAAVLRAVTSARLPDLYLGRAGTTGVGTQPGGSRYNEPDVGSDLRLSGPEAHLPGPPPTSMGDSEGQGSLIASHSS
jgi:hypothetical protein